jgi:hypothetical protein
MFLPKEFGSKQFRVSCSFGEKVRNGSQRRNALGPHRLHQLQQKGGQNSVRKTVQIQANMFSVKKTTV